MNDNAYHKMGYPVVSGTSPFLSITVRNIDLRTLSAVGTGQTYIKMYRVGAEYTYTVHNPIETKNSTFKFVFGTSFLSLAGGRYWYELYYKGNLIGKSQFQYDKPIATFEGSLRV